VKRVEKQGMPQILDSTLARIALAEGTFSATAYTPKCSWSIEANIQQFS
jgi:hypothetical protein